MENENKNTDWLQPDDVTSVFQIARQTVEQHLKRRYADRLISRDVAISRQRVLVEAERILLKMNDAGVGPAELIEWLENKEEIRTGVVRANIQLK